MKYGTFLLPKSKSFQARQPNTKDSFKQRATGTQELAERLESVPGEEM